MSNLYQDAILDAKALRASAMANAKAALEEAFEPKIQEMIQATLAEEANEGLEEIENLEEKEYQDEAITGENLNEDPAQVTNEELEEILAELNSLSEDDSTEQISEAKEGEGDDADGDQEPETDEEPEPDAEAEPEGEPAGEGDEDVKVVELTVGELLDKLRPLLMQADLGADANAPSPEADAEAQAGGIDLDEILAELELEEGIKQSEVSTDMADVEKQPHVKEEGEINEFAGDLGASLAAAGLGTGVIFAVSYLIAQAQEALKTAKKKGVELTGLQKALDATQNAAKGGSSGVIGGTTSMPEATHKELQEAKATIKTLRKDLQEVNLLNAKYLYMNKLFKSKSLTESQKLKVINALDRATTVTEVKHTYEVLRESLETKKQQIKESIGFASKPAGVAPKANIVEADQFISRWQKLAGINK